MTITPTSTLFCCFAIAGSALSAVSAVPTAESTSARSRSMPHPRWLMVYVGGYTDGKKDGLYLYRLDLQSGALTAAGVGPDAISPSFLTISPDHAVLYAVNEYEGYQGTKTGSVSSYRIDSATGELQFINDRSSGGSGPCHLSMDRDGRHVLVANYGSGSVEVLPTSRDGHLADATSFIQHTGSSVLPRQAGPHAHCIILGPDNRFAYATDLGLDRVLYYRFDAEKGTLTPTAPAAAIMAPGSGPRHMAFGPGARTAYVINEINSTMTAMRRSPRTGQLRSFQTLSTLPADFTGTSSTAEVQVSPDGTFLYGSNRGHDSIVIYRLDPATGRMALVGFQPTGGRSPRNFCIDPTGQYLLAANQDSNNIVVCRVNRSTGTLTPTGQTVQVAKPVCIVMTSLPGV